MNFESVVALLENAGMGTGGQDIFIHFIPENRAGLLLKEDFGGTKLDHYLPGYIRGHFWLIARGTDYLTVRTKIQEAANALQSVTKQGAVVDTTTYKYIRPTMKPFPYPPSPGQNIEFAVKMEACYVDVSDLPS